MATPIWSPTTEPKRKYKFLLNIAGIPTYTVKTSDRPQQTIGQQEHKFLAQSYKFPGQVVWNDISVTMVDLIDVDAGKVLYQAIKASGYVAPSEYDMSDSSSPDYYRRTPSKRNAVNSLGNVTIDMLDSDGKVVEEWKLHNVWIKDVNNNGVSYEDEGLVDITMQLAYDWAILT